ncbi:MAG: hypothetical protein GX346_00425 [Clostridiales bacterium]|nr:hypothetical protein [Clostridiales bacterium]
MKYVISLLVFLSLIFSTINGKINNVSESIISSTNNALELCFSLAGIMALWSGLMNIAEKSGLVKKINRLLMPVISFLFNDLPKGSKALPLISMNITANILGLANASTPIGISAMQQIDREVGDGKNATNSMIMLVVLNSASIQIIPTTIIALRARHGAANAAEVMPVIWIVSIVACFSAVFATKILNKRKKIEVK